MGKNLRNPLAPKATNKCGEKNSVVWHMDSRALHTSDTFHSVFNIESGHCCVLPEAVPMW